MDSNNEMSFQREKEMNENNIDIMKGMENDTNIIKVNTALQGASPYVPSVAAYSKQKVVPMGVVDEENEGEE